MDVKPKGQAFSLKEVAVPLLQEMLAINIYINQYRLDNFFW